MRSLKINLQVSLILLLLVGVFIYFGYNNYKIENDNVIKSQDINKFLQVKKYASELVHQLQKERGRTAGYLGSMNEELYNNLITQRNETDGAFTNFSEYLQGFESTIQNDKFEKSISEIEILEGDVFKKVRGQVDNNNAQLSQILSKYTKLVNRIIRMVDDITGLTSDEEYYTLLRTYKSVMEMKERLGLMRAVYSNIFAADTLTMKNFIRTQNLESQLNSFKSDFNYFSNTGIHQDFDTKILPLLKGLDEYKSEVKFDTDSTGFKTEQSFWFTEITKVIDRVYTFEKSISEELQKLSSANKEEALANRNREMLINIVILVLTLFLLLALMQSINYNLKSLKSNFAKVNDEVCEGSTETQINIDKLGADFKEIGELYNKSVSNLIQPIDYIKTALLKMEQGDFTSRLQIKDDMNHKYLIRMINNTLDQLPFEEISTTLMKVKDGDLSARVEGNYKGDSEELKNNINYLNANFGELIAKISELADIINEAGMELKDTSDEMSDATKNQSRQTDDVAAGVEEMSKSISETAGLSQNTANSAESNMKIANQGGEIVTNTITKMKEIGDLVKNSGSEIKKLNEAGKKISAATSVIDEIADQTNMLALNAAIEAARAGEQGRGFAVVADEVRKLAEKTTDATYEISSMIEEIQELTVAAVESMQKGEKVIDSGLSLADEANIALQKILGNASSVKDRLQVIANASAEQDQTSNSMASSVSDISAVTTQNVGKIEGLTELSHRLVEMTSTLEEMLSQFNNNRNTKPNTLPSAINRKLLS